MGLTLNALKKLERNGGFQKQSTQEGPQFQAESKCAEKQLQQDPECGSSALVCITNDDSPSTSRVVEESAIESPVSETSGPLDHGIENDDEEVSAEATRVDGILDEFDSVGDSPSMNDSSAELDGILTRIEQITEADVLKETPDAVNAEGTIENRPVDGESESFDQNSAESREFCFDVEEKTTDEPSEAFEGNLEDAPNEHSPDSFDENKTAKSIDDQTDETPAPSVSEEPPRYFNPVIEPVLEFDRELPLDNQVAGEKSDEPENAFDSAPTEESDSSAEAEDLQQGEPVNVSETNSSADVDIKQTSPDSDENVNKPFDLERDPTESSPITFPKQTDDLEIGEESVVEIELHHERNGVENCESLDAPSEFDSDTNNLTEDLVETDSATVPTATPIMNEISLTPQASKTVPSNLERKILERLTNKHYEQQFSELCHKIDDASQSFTHQRTLIVSPEPSPLTGVLAAHLAMVKASNFDESILLMDVDLQNSELTRKWSLKNHGLTDFMFEVCHYHDLPQHSSISNLKFIGIEESRVERHHMSLKEDFWNEVSKDFQNIFMDGGIYNSTLTNQLITRVQNVLLVIEIGRTKQSNAKKVADAIRKQGGLLLGIVVVGAYRSKT